jgi:threonylcarbamoyladenosine tRNA methylthiotransferase MtaB
MKQIKSFFIQTLGCKVNQYESDGIASGLEAKGWHREKKGKKTDLTIINTCAVTSKAGMQSRQAIRKLIRENPEAKIVVTGCHAQTDPDMIRKIDGVNHIACHKDKTLIADHIHDLIYNEDPCNESLFQFTKPDFKKTGPFRSFPHIVKGHMTRAYLKIQDGCNDFCTYCIVPYARGTSVSMDNSEVLLHLKELGKAGFKEVILTGINIGAYGRDLTPQASLTALLEEIDRQRPVHRIRLSSIEPCEINEDIIRLAGPKHIVCDHFHIPLQSGDDDILKKMNRPYDSALFTDLIQKIHTALPLSGIGVDTLIGFPSETDRQFQNTYELIESLPVSYLHIFPFSSRKGTPAWHFKQKVDENIIKERCAMMRTLDKAKRKAFILANLNKKCEAVVLHEKDEHTGMLKAVTSNYLTVHLRESPIKDSLVEGSPDLHGKIIELIPEQYNKYNKLIIGKGDLHNERRLQTTGPSSG